MVCHLYVHYIRFFSLPVDQCKITIYNYDAIALFTVLSIWQVNDSDQISEIPCSSVCNIVCANDRRSQDLGGGKFFFDLKTFMCFARVVLLK